MAAAGAPGGDPFQEKLTRVTLWLKKLYEGVPIPVYEVNERTVDILHEVMECNEETDRDVMLLIEDMKDQTSKYEAEADYWKDILEKSLGLSEGSLSEEATKDLSDLVESAVELEVEDTSLSSFYCAINDMTSELYKTKSENEEMERKLKTLTEKLTSALMMEKQFEEDIEKLEKSQEVQKAKAEDQSKNKNFLEAKSKDLRIRISNAEDQLVARGLDQSLTHEALMKLSEELAALRKKIEPLKTELASYHDLPPAVNMGDTAHGAEFGVLNRILRILKTYPNSIPLAQVMVEEARRELKALDEELTREIEAVPFELT